MNPQNFVGRTALITGGSQGIGLSIARDLCSNGANVILVARDEVKLREECERLNCSTSFCHYIQVDFEAPNGFQQIASYIEQNSLSIDILINALGGGFGSKSVDDLDVYQKILNLNFLTGHQLTRLLVPGMVFRGWGRVIYIGTLAVNQKSASAPYVASKAALMAYMKVMAKDVATQSAGVILAAVTPGAISVPGKYLNSIETSNPALLQSFLKENGVAAGRLGSVEEVASAVHFLCSNAASYMHGAEIQVDGGASN